MCIKNIHSNTKKKIKTIQQQKVKQKNTYCFSPLIKTTTTFFTKANDDLCHVDIQNQ